MTEESSLKLEKYSRFSRMVHWLTALLIVGMFCTGFIGFSGAGGRGPGAPPQPAAQVAAPAAPGPFLHHGPETDPFATIVLHKELGVTLLMLSVVRLFYRLVNRVPALPADMPKLQTYVARSVQMLIYVGILVQPLTGFFGSGRGYTYFKLFTVQPLPGLVPYIRILHTVHIDGAWTLLGLISLHVIGALYHHYIRKDHVLDSML